MGFREYLKEANDGGLARKFVKNNSPAGTRADVSVDDNMYNVKWVMVQPQDKSKIQAIHDWVQKNVNVEDIDLSFRSGEANLFFVADKLPASMNSQKV